MGLIFWILILIASLIVLVKSADHFTVSAEKLGLWLGMSPFIVGITIVAVGTSLPELISSLISVFSGASEIVMGNVVGSNVANILLIIGVSVIFARKIVLKESFIRIDLMFFFATAFILGFMIIDGEVNLFESILLIFSLALYILYIIESNRKNKLKVSSLGKKKQKLGFGTIAGLVFGALFIYLGAKYTIGSVIAISEMMNIGKELIAVTVVAFGTSLPELVVSIGAAKKGKGDLAIGNVLGSNIFNILLVVGMSGLFGTLIVSPVIYTVALAFMLVATFIYFIIVRDKEITRWEGWLLLILYALFIGKMFF